MDKPFLILVGIEVSRSGKNNFFADIKKYAYQIYRYKFDIDILKHTHIQV